MAWTMMPVAPHHLEPIRDLFQAVWGRARPASFDQWKLFSHLLPACPAIVAMDGARCVGLYTVLPTGMILDGRRIAGAQSVDTMTHPDYRGQGMFTALAEACYGECRRRGITLLYGLPNQNSYHGFVTKLGWTHVDDVQRWLRLLRSPRKVPRPLAALADPVIRLASGLGPLQARVLEIGAFRRLPAQPWFGPAARARAHVAKSRDWLTWRYVENPTAHFELLLLGTTEAPAGLVIVETQKDVDAAGRAFETLQIVECFGPSPAERGAGISAAIRFAARRGCRSVSFWSNDSGLAPLLRRRLFFPRESLPLIYRQLDQEPGRKQLTRGELVIQGGDMD